MIGRRITLLAIAAVVFSAIAIGCFKWFSAKPVLTVFLTCKGDISGTLSAATVAEGGKQNEKEVFDLDAACTAKKIELRHYLRGESIYFFLYRNNDKTATIISEYGRDIQSERNGFYMVLKIMDAPPFIVNDRI